MLKIGGQTVTCYNIGELAKKCGKKADTLRKLEKKGVLPPANFRTKGKLIRTGALAGTMREGERVYSVWLTEQLVPIIMDGVQQGIPIIQETKNKIAELFVEERRKYK